MNNVNSLSKDQCCGCSVCANICPKDAIVMKSGVGGYLVPRIDEARLCIDCGACTRVCPVINPPYKTDIDPETHIVKASDSIRAISSSGGVFRVLSEYVISQGGLVVGAAFDDNGDVNMIIASDKHGIDEISGSKYVESFANDIYQVIKRKLGEGYKILFTGLPCQIAALNNYLGKYYPNLVTVDIICHGPLSRDMFKSFVKERFDKKVVKVTYRNKELTGWDYTKGIVKYYFEDKSIENNSGDLYMKAFLSNLGTRSSCAYCIFAESPRQGDISMGDYWNAKHNNCDYEDDKGISVVSLNTYSGQRLFSEVKEKFILDV